MSYTSYNYLLLFLGSVLIIYTAMPQKLKWLVLLVSSYVFYLISSGRLVLFLVLTTAAVYFAGIFLNKINDSFAIAKKSLEKADKKLLKANIAWQKRAVVAVTLFIIFGFLLVLKYSGFFISSAQTVLKLLHLKPKLPFMKFILPLGISYYTLQAAGYIIDVYRGKYRASENFAKVALFLSFFPQIVEGPIGRFDLLADQLYCGHSFDYDRFTQGIQRIVWGLFKKMVIADRANILVSEVFGNYNKYSGGVILLAGILYTVQIYAEFSGCMDIVIGSAQLFGVEMSENFEQPFFSKSVNEFWRRWHITLGTWLRDYVFYSVSLSKPFMKLSRYTKEHMSEQLGALVPASFALFFTWFGIGFWHGAGVKYIIYGIYYYAIMMVGMYSEPLVAKAFQTLKINRNSLLTESLRIIRTTALVVVGMMLFRAETVKIWAGMMVKIFTSFSAATLLKDSLSCGMDKHDFLIVALGVAVIFVVSLLKEKGVKIRESLAKQKLPVRWAVYACLALSVIIFGAYGIGYDAVDFIYGQF
ncbi:MAG: MBOAT family O-acyltransferase [Acutalibacteraceae bacterium]|nr:MBOAT family O-acyltransferase [Acutalibacteraceae bacterium]